MERSTKGKIEHATTRILLFFTKNTAGTVLRAPTYLSSSIQCRQNDMHKLYGPLMNQALMRYAMKDFAAEP